MLLSGRNHVLTQHLACRVRAIAIAIPLRYIEADHVHEFVPPGGLRRQMLRTLRPVDGGETLVLPGTREDWILQDPHAAPWWKGPLEPLTNAHFLIVDFSVRMGQSSAAGDGVERRWELRT